MNTIELMGGTREIFLRLAVATLIGGALGFNRELRDKPAGLRTHALVALGACLVTIVSIQLAFAGGTMDASAVTRAVQGIITGIGFLGGGVIMRTENSPRVQGLTTAATVWIVAALGIACGAGQWQTALMALGIALIVLVLGKVIEGMIHHRVRSDPEDRHSTAGPADGHHLPS
jgi:putative Mg2+ transporter-C (MgtC) family protein